MGRDEFLVTLEMLDVKYCFSDFYEYPNQIGLRHQVTFYVNEQSLRCILNLLKMHEIKYYSRKRLGEQDIFEVYATFISELL